METRREKKNRKYCAKNRVLSCCANMKGLVQHIQKYIIERYTCNVDYVVSGDACIHWIYCIIVPYMYQVYLLITKTRVCFGRRIKERGNTILHFIQWLYIIYFQLIISNINIYINVIRSISWTDLTYAGRLRTIEFWDLFLTFTMSLTI